MLFCVFDADLKLIGLAHLAYLPEIKGQARAAEFGVSVLPEVDIKGLAAHCCNAPRFIRATATFKHFSPLPSKQQSHNALSPKGWNDG